jgi:hypothetical protein
MASNPPVSLYFAIVLAAVSAYLVTRLFRPGITDSPWLWAFAFSAMGTIGVLVIAPKYDDRQKRLEARYEGRERIAALRQANSSADASQSPGLENPESYGYGQTRQVPLIYLGSLSFLAAIGTGYMLWRTEQRPAGPHDNASANTTTGALHDQNDQDR